MNWYKKSQSLTTMYHHTTPDRLPKILKEGLKINSPWSKSQASKDYIEQVYGIKPIFLATNPETFKEQGDITLICSVNPNNMAADIPSLYDFGAYIEEDQIWWKKDEEPEILKNYIDQDVIEGISYTNLLDPHSEVARKCIELTKSAAYLEDIPASNIRQLSSHNS